MKIKIGESFETDSYNIVFYEKDGMDAILYNFYTGDTKRIKTGEAFKNDFIFKVPSRLMPDLLKAMADCLEEQRVQTDSQAKIEGTLNATKYHLEDLRKLLKLNI